MGDSPTVRASWRGIETDQRTVAMLTELAALTPTMPTLTPTQGSYRTSSSYSADTHNGAGAVDLSVTNLTVAQQTQVETLARRVGFAAWVRPAISGLWPRHIHMIAIPPSGSVRNDGALSSGAFAQVQAYYKGRNGLATAGIDSGVRSYVGQTWETYVGTKPRPAPAPSPGFPAPSQQEDIMATAAELRTIVAEEIQRSWWLPLDANNPGLTSTRTNHLAVATKNSALIPDLVVPALEKLADQQAAAVESGGVDLDKLADIIITKLIAKMSGK